MLENKQTLSGKYISKGLAMYAAATISETLPCELEAQVMVRAEFECELCGRAPGEKIRSNCAKPLAACSPSEVICLCQDCYLEESHR